MKKVAILAELITEVLKHGVSENDVVLVLTEQELREKESMIRQKLRELTDETVANAVRIIAHQPGDRRHVAFLGASPKGEPIGFCREIVDADLVIPVRGKASTPLGPFAEIFSRFADQESQLRFVEAQNGKKSSVLKRRLTAEVAEAVRLLGLVISIQHTENEWTVSETHDLQKT